MDIYRIVNGTVVIILIGNIKIVTCTYKAL